VKDFFWGLKFVVGLALLAAITRAYLDSREKQS
jgi:hypothetical protein